MNLYRKLPIGVQSFEVMRNDKFLYVDKTEFVFKLTNSNRVYFLSRPRRFGKSLFLSTLEAYFLGKKELFKGLYIEKAEEERAKAENSEPWIEYPVLYLDFNIGKYDEPNSLKSHLNLALSKFEQIYGAYKQEEELAQRFAGIVQRAYEKTGRQVVILVDEYDKPLLQTMSVNETLNEEFRSTLKSFYSVIKTCDKYIRFAFLTGVTKFSKVSIFSDLNNLQDISLHEDCSALCGITQEELTAVFSPEIQVLADKEKISYEECLSLLKKRYDGYLFAKEGKNVYNPFSLLNAFSAKDVGSYWFATGTPTFLVNYLKDAHYNIPDLDGKVELDEAGLADYRADTKNPLPILFQSGYLTIKEYIREAALYRLGFPNDEVRYGFFKNLLPDYTSLRTDQTASSVWRFTEDVKNGNVAGFMERMQSIIAGVPYDNLPKDKLKLREQNYQTAVYLIFKLMGQFVETEVHCAAGRADSIVHTKDTIYIFEFKLDGNGSAEDAIAQIKEKGYVVPFKSSGKKIVLIGSSFDEKERTIKDWKYETFDNQ
ncbi:ATP-binding protein [Treponema sp. OMZ 799]|uniref:ATP-binding protein n=1 Tax=Treponema sp. OMZ 799 TaxID=2563668 RepID=UPI0020A521EC|nr:ATP-binding protein [Treponema sp. OMZ 799]UTC77020.1 ATP-binding protein [Treponema sp. OMZ 799]